MSRRALFDPDVGRPREAVTLLGVELQRDPVVQFAPGGKKPEGDLGPRGRVLIICPLAVGHRNFRPELLGEKGVAIEKVRFANLVSFTCLKAFALDQRPVPNRRFLSRSKTFVHVWFPCIGAGETHCKRRTGSLDDDGRIGS
jgi:hypothetical protein